MRRAFLVAVAALALLSSPTGACARQPGRIPVIGFLLGASERIHGIYVDRLRQGLAQAGLVDGRDVVLECRFADGKPSLGREQAAELARRRVEVIVAGTLPAAQYAAEATRTIPIVVAFASDLLGSGLIASLAKPGGNVTGMTSFAQELAAKQLEQVAEAVPGVSRVALMFNPTGPAALAAVARTRAAAERLGIYVQEAHVRSPAEFADAFATLSRERAGALILVVDPVTATHRRQLIALAGARKLPTMCWRAAMVRDGCLLGYGADRGRMVDRAAQYVARILRGANPADLPVEQPTEFELAVNLKTAKSLGITIPQSVLLRADEVVE